MGSRGRGSRRPRGSTFPLHGFLRSCFRTSSPSEGMLERVREPRLPQRARAATCGCVPAEFGAAGWRRAGRRSKKCQLPRALTSDRPLRSSVSWPLSTFFSLSMSAPRPPPPLAFAPPTTLPGAQPPPLRPPPTTARPAQAPAHLPARHAPRQPRPLSELLGVTWGGAERVGVKSARRYLTRKLAVRPGFADSFHRPAPPCARAWKNTGLSQT